MSLDRRTHYTDYDLNRWSVCAIYADRDPICFWGSKKASAELLYQFKMKGEPKPQYRIICEQKMPVGLIDKVGRVWDGKQWGPPYQVPMN